MRWPRPVLSPPQPRRQDGGCTDRGCPRLANAQRTRQTGSWPIELHVVARRSSSTTMGEQVVEQLLRHFANYDTDWKRPNERRHMRIAINMPLKDATAFRWTPKASWRAPRMVEDADLDAYGWRGSSPGMTRPDALMWLLVACAATDHIEVGTSILQIPLRHPVELAQRLLTCRRSTRRAGSRSASARAPRATTGVGRGRLRPAFQIPPRTTWM